MTTRLPRVKPNWPFRRRFPTTGPGEANVQTLDWNDNTGIPNYVPGLDDGLSGYPSKPGGYDYIATEAFGYVQLAAGAHRFAVAQR